MVGVFGQKIFGVEHLFEGGLAAQIFYAFEHRGFFAALYLPGKRQLPKRQMAVLKRIGVASQSFEIQIYRVVEVVAAAASAASLKKQFRLGTFFVVLWHRLSLKYPTSLRSGSEIRIIVIFG